MPLCVRASLLLMIELGGRLLLEDSAKRVSLLMLEKIVQTFTNVYILHDNVD
jgi:hypothetical protein